MWFPGALLYKININKFTYLWLLFTLKISLPNISNFSSCIFLSDPNKRFYYTEKRFSLKTNII